MQLNNLIKYINQVWFLMTKFKFIFSVGLFSEVELYFPDTGWFSGTCTKCGDAPWTHS